MILPKKLQDAIIIETEKFRFEEILEAREELTSRYRGRHQKTDFMSTGAERCAYIAARMPATFAVICRVMHEIRLQVPEMNFSSVLDLGAGPGSVMWAVSEIVPEVSQFTLVEKDVELMKLGQRLAAHSEHPAIRNGDWQLGNLEQSQAFPLHDLVTLSYSIGELPSAAIELLIERSWEAAKQFLVVIEPGTPAGFERIRSIRANLLGWGGYLVAPCPHPLACPMEGKDWCHFSERVERSSLHRRLKGGSFGHEDEKFSYVVFSKTPVSLPKARILRHPLKRTGHVVLNLCTSDGIKQETISKRDPESYKKARKLDWGSAI